MKLTETLDHFLGREDYVKLSVKQFEINNNAEFQLMQTQEELSKKMVGLQRWSYAPTITGNYGYNYKILKPSFDMSPKHSASLTMNIPIFSGISITHILFDVQLRDIHLLIGNLFRNLTGLHTQNPLTAENQLRNTDPHIRLVFHLDRISAEIHLVPEIGTVIQFPVHLRQPLRNRLSHILIKEDCK